MLKRILSSFSVYPFAPFNSISSDEVILNGEKKLLLSLGKAFNKSIDSLLLLSIKFDCDLTFIIRIKTKMKTFLNILKSFCNSS